MDYYAPDLDNNSHFKCFSSSSNYVYFKCVYRRNNCPGTIRQNIKTKEINIITHCDNKINHKSITINEFRKYYDKKQYNTIPMESIRLQKYYVKLYIEANKEEINITDLKKKFKEETGKELTLDNYIIGKIKCSIKGSFKGKEFYEICLIISEKNENIITKFFDIRYNVNIKGNNSQNSELELREEKIILIATKKSIEFLKPTKAIEYFVDITFKLTPRVHRPYKIMTISCLDKEDQIPRLVCLIALLYLDTVSYTKIFSYLKENYFFYPKVIHLDYEAPLSNSIINSGIFEEKPLLVSCFFHFSANIRRNMEKLKIAGKQFNKSAI